MCVVGFPLNKNEKLVWTRVLMNLTGGWFPSQFNVLCFL